MANVEERLARVEQEVAELKAKAESHSTKAGWLKKVEGSFKNDPEFLEIVRLGREAREAEKLQD